MIVIFCKQFYFIIDYFHIVFLKLNSVRQMLNIGRTNHNKFRTKYWKQRQTISNQYTDFIQNTVISGSPIAKTIFTSRHLQDKLYPQQYLNRDDYEFDPHHATYIHDHNNRGGNNKSKSKSRSRDNNEDDTMTGLNNNANLKLQLFKLVHNEHVMNRDYLQKGVNEMNRYVGYGRYIKGRRIDNRRVSQDFRPFTSLNMDRESAYQESKDKERKEITLKQKLLYYEKNNHSNFLPLTPSKNQRPHRKVIAI